jgi:hypothetical protein
MKFLTLLFPILLFGEYTKYLSVKDALKEAGFSKYRNSTNEKIGVMMWEFENECPKGLDSSRVTIHDVENSDKHATEVGHILLESSPYTYIHCMEYNVDIEPEKFSPKIYASNHSYRLYTSPFGEPDLKTYGVHDKYLDNYVMEHKLAMFVAGGNRDSGIYPDGRKYVTSPAKAYNVISVGNYTKKVSGIPNSITGNPSSDAEKPETLSHGSFKFPDGTKKHGSSFSTPFVTSAFGVNLLSKYKSFRYQPQLLKAYILTLGDFPISKNGVGEIKWGGENSYKAWWNSDVSLFKNGIYLEKSRYLEAGKRYRVAISWLVDGNFAMREKKMNLDLDLFVFKEKELFWRGVRRFDNFEVLELYPQKSGIYTFQIRKNRFEKFSNSTLYLGLVIRNLN